jgi:hypothetical protein
MSAPTLTFDYARLQGSGDAGVPFSSHVGPSSKARPDGATARLDPAPHTLKHVAASMAAPCSASRRPRPAPRWRAPSPPDSRRLPSRSPSALSSTSCASPRPLTRPRRAGGARRRGPGHRRPRGARLQRPGRHPRRLHREVASPPPALGLRRPRPDHRRPSSRPHGAPPRPPAASRTDTRFRSIGSGERRRDERVARGVQREARRHRQACCRSRTRAVHTVAVSIAHPAPCSPSRSARTPPPKRRRRAPGSPRPAAPG